MNLTDYYHKEQEDKKWEQELKDYTVAFLVTTLFLLLIATLCTDVFASGQVDQTKAVIHHTASHDVSRDTIDKWHKERGWDGIGYHYVIRKDGSIEIGRNRNITGAHAKGRNNRLGIALTGYDEFTPEQIESLTEFLVEQGITHIEPHHEECPSHGLDLNQIKKEIN